MKTTKNPIISGNIELVPVNSGFSICLSPESCIIPADFDGNNPNLSNASTRITVISGQRALKINVSVLSSSSPGITTKLTKVNEETFDLFITSIPQDIASGYIELQISTSTNDNISTRFMFSVIRESTMLDWIKDWNSNKTEISGDYFISPKIFVGKKETLESGNSVLTGTYIGPNDANGTGLYGYLEGKTIFKLDENGGEISGWTINPDGMFSPDNKLQILSKGEIKSQYQDTVFWKINADGSAEFSQGNVQFNADGSAEFSGTIHSQSGEIGCWKINDQAIFTGKEQHSGFTDSSDSITIGVTGIRGYQWRLESDGSGSLSAGNISWDINGKLKIIGTIKQISGDGVTETPIPAWKGEWKPGMYYPNDEVTHLGATWLCIAETYTEEEPSVASNDWMQTVSEGKDAITVDIYSTNGLFFQNGKGQTELYAIVKKGDIDITSDLPSGRFSWTRTSKNTEADAVWNKVHQGAGARITITPDDVEGKSNFDCIITI